MNLLSFLSDPLYDVNFLAKKHIHVVSPIKFDVMVDSLFFIHPCKIFFSIQDYSTGGGEGRGDPQGSTWREDPEEGSLFLLEIL